jgi:hypothetical protein
MGVVYLAAIFGLIVWEYRDHVQLGASGCESPVPESKSSLYARSYERLLDWASGESAGHVTAIAIPADLEDIHGNLCQARSYLADLVLSVAAQHPAEIVIDKFFSPSSCANFPQNTADLLAAVRSVAAPVIIGESANTVSAQQAGSCLVRKPQLDFGAPNVIHGLTRINKEAEKVPLQWHIFPSDPQTTNSQPGLADSLSLAAVKAYDSDYQQHRRLQVLLSKDDHPYANLGVSLPRETSTDLLCDAGTPAMRQRWGLACTGPAQHLNLLGKVVVIGAEDERDHWPVLDSRMWGFELQARYIQVMLSGSYLRALPVWVAFFTFASFIFMIEGLPTVLEALVPHWKKHWFLAHAFTERRYLWVVFWMVCFPCVLTVLALSLGYLPPLAVFGDIFFVAITRLFFFAAESTGTPFLNPKKKGTS